MTEKILKVNMLGTFSLSFDGNHIDCDMNRSKNIWLTLAFLLYNHDKVVSTSKILSLIGSDGKERANPTSTLKTTLHRVRSMLDMLYHDAGHSMIISTNGGYRWNPDITIELDTEEFEKLCTGNSANDENSKIEELISAVSLYRGEFLGKLSSNVWAVPIATYFNNLYMQAFQKLLPLLYDAKRYQEATLICREALLVDPYQEIIYQHLMKNLLAQDKRSEAVQVYEELSKILFSNFSVAPTPESHKLYREALKVVNRDFVHPGLISEQLRENTPIQGALVCDYDFFRMLYQTEMRRISRSGEAAHIALMSMSASYGKNLSKKSLDHAMDNLQEHLHLNLRRGDIISRCSPCQFVVMLPSANYENSRMVCNRLIKAFYRLYPHSPTRIEFTIQPLSCDIGDQPIQ